MSKFSEKVTEILGVSQNPGFASEFRNEAKNDLKLTKIILVIMIMCAIGQVVDLIGNIVTFGDMERTEALGKIYRDILYLIDFTAFSVICVLGCKIFRIFGEKETPFTEEIPGKIKQIASVMLLAFVISSIVVCVFPAAADISRPETSGFFSNGLNTIVAVILLLLARIFEYGVTLQRDSDETI